MQPQRVVIVGAGYTGLTAACMLARTGVDVTILEKEQAILPPTGEPSRLLALAMGSIVQYQNSGIRDIENLGQAINHIRVWDYTSNATLDFEPQTVEADCFGYMLEEQQLRDLLMKAIAQYPNITIHYGTSPSKVRYTNDLAHIDCGTESFIAELMIVADGRSSGLCKRLGVEVQVHDYKQMAIVCDVEHSADHCGVAVEQFLPSGPFAILPKKGGHSSSIVWVEDIEVQESLQAMSAEDIQMLIAMRFDGYLGEISLASKARFFPLRLVNCRQYFAKRVVVVGDAAHAIHPLAGQGFNLAVRDIACLAQLIQEQLELGLNIGSEIILRDYNRQRQGDSNLMIEATHALNCLFVNNIMPLPLIRGLGLRIVDKLPQLKRNFIRYAMGL